MGSDNREPRIVAIMSGRATGPFAAVSRILLSLAEPFYIAVVRIRNWMFDVGLMRSHAGGRPVISLGNLTTGGTGKTPIVAWLVRELSQRGERPAVLLRGYKSVDGVSDEAKLLERLVSPAIVIAQPDRVAGAAAALERDSKLTCFVLDDGFQHRRLSRSWDIVLIDATEPFGFDHVLPRGLLREPVDGLRRCDCVIITRCDQIYNSTLHSIEEHVHSVDAHLIFKCSMRLDHFLDGDGNVHAIGEAEQSFAVCGIGNPRNFFKQMARDCGPLVGERSFADHHAYSAADFADVVRDAKSMSAKQIVTTEKDWTKLEAHYRDGRPGMAVWRAVLRVEFKEGDSKRLIDLVTSVINQQA